MKYHIDVTSHLAFLATIIPQNTEFTLVECLVKYVKYFVYDKILRANDALAYRLEDDFRFVHSKVDENFDYIVTELNQTLGKYLIYILDETITTYTHKVYVNIDTLSSIVIDVEPIQLTFEQYIDIHVASCIENGGWVSEKIRNSFYEHLNN